MEDKQLTPDQSFELIRQMIRQTRRRVERNAGIPFILFGYTTVVTAIAVWLAVTLTHNNMWQLLWFTISAVAVVFWLTQRKKKRQEEVSTYVDRIVGYVWITMGMVAFLQTILAMFVYTIPILYIIVLLIGMQMALTGLIIRFRIVAVAGFVAALVLAPVFLFVEGIDACLVFAAVFLVTMVIPGHILNYKSNHTKKQ